MFVMLIFFVDYLFVVLLLLFDVIFVCSVVLICQYDENGVMGVLVNQFFEYMLGEVFVQMDIIIGDGDLQVCMVFNGGLVYFECGFVIYDDVCVWDFSLIVGYGLYLIILCDIFEVMVCGEGLVNVVVIFGCVGWGVGQLESELFENSWLIVLVDVELVFQLLLEQCWQGVVLCIGVDLFWLIDYSGYV